VVWTSATSLTANLTATATANATARNVTVTNPDGKNARCTNCLTVTATAGLTSISPATLQAGQTNQAITINGTGFTTATGVTVSFGSGVTVTSLTRNSNTRLTARVTVAPTATPGTRDVTLTVPGQAALSLAGAFGVTAPLAVTGVTPTSMKRGGVAQTLTINGSGLVSGARVTISGNGMSVGTVHFVSGSQLTVPLTITTRANVGNRTVTVTNPNGTKVTATLAVTA
jgi:hypothetical protein